MGEQKTSQSTAEIPMYTSAFHIQLVCPLTRMARLMLFLFSLGLTAAQPAQEGSGSLKRENPNPLESRVAAVVKDASSCLSYEVRVSGKAVIKEAVTPGGTYTSVRDRIKHASSLDVLFTVVGGWNNNWNFGYTGHTSCGNWVTGISDTGDDYQVFFFLDPLGRSGL